MAYLTDYKVQVPTKFLQRWDTSSNEKIQKHLKELRKLRVKVDLNDPGKREITKDIVIHGNTKQPSFTIWDHTFRHHKKNIFYNEESCSFYDYKDAFKELSSEIEGLRYVDCTGEEGETWRVYVKDGKSYQVTPTFPDFDENQLE